MSINSAPAHNAIACPSPVYSHEFDLLTAAYAAFRQNFHLSKLCRFPEPALTIFPARGQKPSTAAGLGLPLWLAAGDLVMREVPWSDGHAVREFYGDPRAWLGQFSSDTSASV